MERVELKIYHDVALPSPHSELRAVVNKWKFQDAMMGEQFITFTITSETPIDWSVGDYCQFRGETYTLNYVPSVTQKARTRERQDAYTYENVKFESFQEELTRCIMLDITPTTGDYVAALGTNYTGSSKFQLFCGETSANGSTLTAVCALAAKMQANLDRMFSRNRWKIFVDTTTTYLNSAGNAVLVTHTEDKVLSFDNTTVGKALEEVHNTFDLDYCIRGRNIYIGYNLKNLTSDNADETFVFGYGKGYVTREDQNKALFQIKRIANSQQKIVTRLRALGSTKNMPYRYYNSKYNLSQSLFPTNLQLPDTFETPDVKAANNALRDSTLRAVKGDTNDAYIDKNDDAEHCAEGIREDSARWDGTNGELPEIYPTIEEATYGELRNALVQDQDGNTGQGSFPNYGDNERIDKLLAIGCKDGDTLFDDANKGNGILPESGMSSRGIPRSANIGMTYLTYNTRDRGDFTNRGNVYAGPEKTLFTIQGVYAGRYAMAPTIGAVLYGFSISCYRDGVSADVGYIITIKQRNLQTGETTTIATYTSEYQSISRGDGVLEMELPEIPDVKNGANAKVSEVRVTELSDITVTFTPVMRNVIVPSGFTDNFSLAYMVGNSRLDNTVTYDPEYNWISIDDSDSLTDTFHVFIQDMGFDLQACWTDETPVIAMKSGRCVGREFEIGENFEKVTHNGKKGYMLTLKRATDNTLNTYYPSATDPIAAGDYFVLLNISMPDVYVKMAEIRLLRAATEYLADNCETKFTYQPSIDDIYLQRNYDNMVKAGRPQDSIFWRLYAGLKFTFRGIPSSEDSPAPLADITIEQVSIQMGESLTPKVELKLNDDVQQSTIQKLTTSVDRIYNGSIFNSGSGGSGSPGAMAAAVLSILQSEGEKLFLSKKHNDTAKGKITFKGGAEFGRFSQGVRGGRIDPGGNGELENLTVRDSIVVSNLTVTKAAHFFKLIIDELKSIGGQIIVTAANATLDKVVPMTSTDNEAGDGDTIAYWRCYFRAKDADRKAIRNQFDQNDMAVCMTFDAAEGTYYNVSNKYYWRKVLNTGTDTLLNEDTGEEDDYHYIDLSATDKDPDCNGVPEAGDQVAQLGNSNDTRRQNAIIISAYQGIDTTVQAPSIVQYTGIDDYNLSEHKYNVIAANGNVFRGEFRSIASTTAGQSLDELISGLSGQVDQVKGQVDNKFEIWYGHGTPTLENEPAVYWTDAETRDLHLQDIYYDLDREPASNGGNCYRFELTDGVYGWNQITDEHTLMALDKIADVASDGKLTGGMEKTRVYIDWMKAVQDFEKYGEQACDYAIDEQDTPNAYSVFVDKFRALANMLDGGSSDYDNVEPGDEVGTPSWLLDLAVTTTIAPTTATEYRNTWNEYYAALASLMKEIQRQAKLRADNAQATAETALSQIRDMGSDGKLDPSEKVTVKRDFVSLYHEMMDTDDNNSDYATGILDKAKDSNDVYIISEQDYITPYINAFNAIGTYLNGGSTWTLPDFDDAIDSNGNFIDSYLPLWLKDTGDHMEDTEIINADTWVNLWSEFYARRAAVLGELSNLAHERLDDIADDGIISAGSEKSLLYLQWMRTVAEYKKYIEQAGDYFGDNNTEDDELVAAYKKVAVMLNNGNPNNASATISSDILDGLVRPSWLTEANMKVDTKLSLTPTTNAATFNAVWKNYQNALNSLLSLITKKAKNLADAAQTTAVNAMNLIGNMGDDSLLDPSEKLTVKREFIACYHEMMDTNEEGYASGILDMAKDVNKHWIISYDKYIQPYYDAFLALGQYLDGSEQWQIPVLADFDDAALPSWIQEENMGDTNTIDGDVWRSLWADFYTKRTAVLTALTSHAQETAESKVNVFVTSYDDEVPHPVPPYKAGDIWLHTLSDGQRKTYIAIVTKTSGSYDPSDWKDMTDIKPSFRTMVEKMLLDGTIRTYIEDAISNSTSFRIWFVNGGNYRIIQDTSSNRYILQQYVSENWVAVTSSKGWIAYYHGSGNLLRGIYVYSGTSWIKITNDGLSSVMEEILTCWGERYSTCYTDKSSSATDKDLCIRDVGYWDALENKQQSTGLREIFMYNQIQWELISDSITSLLENLGNKIRALVYDANGHSLIEINANNILLETAARLEGDRKNFPVLKPWWDSSTGKTSEAYLSDPIRYNGSHDIYSYPTWLKKGVYKLKFFVNCNQGYQLSSIAICQYGTTFPSDRTTYQSIELPDLTYDGTTLSGMYGFGGVVEIPSDGYYALNWWESYYIYIPDMSEESESLVAQLAAGLATKVNATGSGANAFATLFANAVDNNDDIVKQAQLVTYVEMDKNGKIVSGVSLDADQVNFTANKVMINNKFWIDADGNVCMANATVSGTIKAEDGEIGGFNIGTDKLSNTNYGASIEIANAASNPTKRTIIGKAAVDTFTNRECSMVAENKESGQTYNTALFLNAVNATYNYAFHGNGNGVLNGLMFGYKTQNKAVSKSSDDLGSISLTDGATILITGFYGGNHTITLPQLSNVRKCLGISDVSTPFSIEVEIINLTSGNLNMRFRGYEGYTSVEYPYLMSNNGGTESGGAAIVTITPGGYVKMRLIYVRDGQSYRAHRLVYNHE